MTNKAVKGFLRILDERAVPLEDLPKTLEKIAHRHQELVARLSVLDSSDAEIGNKIDQARDATENSDYDRADELLSEAEEMELAAVQAAEKLAQEARAAADRRLRRAAEARSERGELSITRLDYRQAAKHFRDAAALIPGTDTETRSYFLGRSADALTVEQGRTALHAGLEAARQGDRTSARGLLADALVHFNEIRDPVTRRGELGSVALAFERAAFPDLALTAAQGAVALDRALNERRPLGEDILTCGNAHLHMGNISAAKKCYEEALAICIENDDLDNAASASTNLAIIIGRQGRLAGAIRRLNDSLGFLKEKPHDETEIITRIALIQALEAAKMGEGLAIKTAKALFEKFGDQLRKDQWDNSIGPLRGIVARHLKAHPDLNATHWKAENFPGLPL